MTTAQRTHRGPLFLVPVIFRFILAHPLVWVLLAVLAFVLWPRPKPLAPEAISPAVATPDGAFTAQVWRHETRCRGLGEPPLRFTWLLRVTSPAGTHECEVGWLGTDAYQVEANRKVRVSISWTVPGQVLYVGSVFGSVTVYVLDTCIMPTRSPTAITTDPIALPDTLRLKLERLHLPASEINGLRYVQLQGHYCGALAKDFVCEHADVLLVIGPGFSTHGQIISKGPVLLIGEAWCSRDIGSNKWVFFDDDARSTGRVEGIRIYAVDSPSTRWIRSHANVTTIPSDRPDRPGSARPETNPGEVRQSTEIR